QADPSVSEAVVRVPTAGLLFADELKGVLADGRGDSLSNPMTERYLAKLNPEQRLAVEHSVANAEPLLIIAGAGTGKTNTLAHFCRTSIQVASCYSRFPGEPPSR